jgi:hypothetical protein
MGLRLKDALDAFEEGAQATAEVGNDSDGSSSVGEKPILFAHVARTPEDSEDKGLDSQSR